MALTVLSVAYPFAPVGPDAVGGAEQIVAAIDAGLVRRGHRSIVVAQQGSQVCGRLVAVPAVRGPLGDEAREAGRSRTQDALAAVLAQEPVDVVHLHGIDFHRYLPGGDVPVLATLHLPPGWYAPEALRPARPATFLHCVSRTQHEACPPGLRLLQPIENGVPDALFETRLRKRDFALFLGRICPEKGVHLAIEAAAAARLPLLIGGRVFAYPDHLRYFEDAVRPRLGPTCRFLGPLGFTRKRRLLSAARCLLLPSLAAETSSLVAREALACGTPVVAFDRGALRETVEDGRTGYLVRDEAELAAAIAKCRAISAETCRKAARRFSMDRMIEAYLAMYRQIAGAGAEAPAGRTM
ncbi:glycosyltransferase family 4 protein [Propylenella binzhouense]|uniref:Glycosyltransferase family 4 protein n=1 Tax=Propylenella binzhouense TaxID=2555902 RepID=A0A964WS13_9HYPH|nr:glycosyltransferase family 4 protein [Propylenella binzhouense]MYZ46488.1 glycosyltransferase family 4 protein [Propylenella binzhouense]